MTTTHRELLELAARAAGCALPGKDDHDEIGRQYDYHLGLWVLWDHGQWGWFRPHLDDGQTFRLAVKLGLAVIPYPIYEQPKHSVIAKVYKDSHAIYRGGEGRIEQIELYGDDPAAATRLAITRAAAEIGKSMEAEG